MIFTTASISSTITSLDESEINGVVTECQIWDINRLFRVCGSTTGRRIIEIDFKDNSQYGIPCLEASGAETEDFKSYLCIIPGTLLADIYDKYGSSLLEGNVRSFLSTKVAVNKKIRYTIQQNPERFFAYNNGISATAMNVVIENTPHGNFITLAKDFQIINGGQTTASLSNARYKDKADLSSIYVQMKLTVIEGAIDDDKASDLVQQISRSSNSQNKVSDADFFSTHPFHVNMERFSMRMFARAIGGSQFDTKWFYERARGQYLQKQIRLTPSEKRKFLLQNPKNQVITKTDLAKVRNTWDGLPHIVSKGAQTNFSTFAQTISDIWNEKNGELLFGERYFQESVALCIIFRYTESMITKQDWYQQSYRANIVTYTIALFHKQIKTQFSNNDLDLFGIWNRQTVPIPVKKSLTELSELVYEKLTAPDRVVENVTQWCKREGCWNSVQTIEYNLPIELKTCLISREEMRELKREAKKNQKIVTDTDIMTKIADIPPLSWRAALEFATAKNKVTQDELSSLRIAAKIPAKFPTPQQCKKLLVVLERLQEEGFKL
jgi:hypothetical protein